MKFSFFSGLVASFAHFLGLKPCFANAVNLSSANNIQINPVNVLWRIEAQEKLDFTASSGSPMNNQKVQFFTAAGVGHYFWANYNSTGSDPGGTGTGHSVAIASGAADSSIATDFSTAISAVSGFSTSVDSSGKVVTVTRTLDTGCGPCTGTTCGLAGVTFTQVRLGQDFNLGLLSGDINPKFAPTNLVIHAHQYGKTPLANFNQGFDKIECTTKLLESDLTKLKTLFSIYGGAVTGGSSEVDGAGLSVLGTNIMVQAARLIFKPVNSTDHTKDFFIALALPIPGSLVFSGENPEELEVTWNGFADLSLNSKINVVGFGNLYQSGLTA